MKSKSLIPFPFDRFPELQSERLTFNAVSPADAKSLLALRSNETVIRFIKRSLSKDLDAIHTFIDYIQKGYSENNIIFWTIKQKGSQVIIGTISLWHFSEDKTEGEIGYELHPDYWKQGFADEAVKRVLAFGFGELNLKKIEAFTHRDNVASRQLLARNQFVLQPDRVDAGNVDNLIYVLGVRDCILG